MMNDNARWTRTGNASRLSAFPLIGWLLLGALTVGLPACQEKKSNVDEALEEMQDEAKDAKDEIKDEIDDHT